jgi:formylglycine-generating enzyme required for sulfatase activity
MEDRIFVYMTKKTLLVPAIIIGLAVLLLWLGGYLPFTHKAAVSPVISQQQIAPVTPDMEGVGKLPESGTHAMHSPAKPLPGMVLIPGGKFIMGSPKGVGNTNEHPRHEVVVDSFYMDTTEVTQAEYARVMGVNPSLSEVCAACPVENVTWDDAVTYCRKVGKRLPTEAEWEYACRAGSTTMNYWGDDRNEKYAWFRENSEEKVHPVAQKKPNKFGLHDMIGNVWEWCGDWYDSAYYSKNVLHNPLGPDSGMHRIFRGGSWLSDAPVLRSSSRDAGVPESRGNLFGFRCVCSR